MPDQVQDLSPLLVAPLLADIAAQAADADTSRSVADSVISQLKNNDVMRLSATAEIGGLDGSIEQIGKELEAVAAACGSTAWVLWNHLCVFHFYCGLLGAPFKELLGRITHERLWVCLPAGAGTSVVAIEDGDDYLLSGEAAFGSGARYSDYVGVTFVLEGEKAPRFALVPQTGEGLHVDPTWKAMSLRASATDHIRYDKLRVPKDQVVPFPFQYRVLFRDADHPHVNSRYSEDWVALSDVWLGCMAVGVAQVSLTETVEGIRDRIAIMGVKMAQRPTIHVNLGQAQAMINAARDTVYNACRETDQRIAAGVIPEEGDYLRQASASMMALQLCDDAMRLILRVLGGNGLREGPSFERRYRDFQAMPLHINAHRDRVSELAGRHLLGLDTVNPF